MLTALAAVAGCGFAPAFGPMGAASKLIGTVTVETPDTVLGFQMRARIDDRLGPETDPQLRLVIGIDTDLENAAVNPDGAITRFRLTGRAEYRLTDRSGAEQAKGKAQAFTSYSATGSTMATQTAAQDAQARLAILLADIIVSDLILLAGDPQ